MPRPIRWIYLPLRTCVKLLLWPWPEARWHLRQGALAAAAWLEHSLARGRTWTAKAGGAGKEALALTEYGRRCLQLGRLADAEMALQRALALDPGSPLPARLLAYVALDAEDWPKAERHWRDLADQLQKPEEKSEALVNLGLALSRQERFAEAKAALEEARARHGSVMALRMLGQLAAEQRDWRQAVDHWQAALPQAGDAEEHADILLSLYYGHRGLGQMEAALAFVQRLGDFCRDQQGPQWEARRHTAIAIQARDLQILERYAEAIDLVESVGAKLRAPRGYRFRKHYIDAFLRPEVRGNGERLVASCEGGFLSARGSVHDHRLVEILIHCNRLQTARRVYARCFDALAGSYGLRKRLELAGGLFQGEEKAHWYGRILESATAMRRDAAHDLQQMQLELARLSALYGLRDDAGFGRVAKAFHGRFPAQAAEHLALYRRMCQMDAGEDQGQGKVFGIGLTRTATTSLNHALRTLGYNAAHFTNPYSRELIEARDIRLFDGLTDVPVAWQFEALFERYPKAAFIYTTRPLEQWQAGLLRHFHWYHNTPTFDAFRRQLEEAKEYPHGEALRQIYQKLYGPHETPAAAYLAHERRVHAFFAERPEARFLELNIFAEGAWDRLAGFLGRAAPEAPFPHHNLAAEERIFTPESVPPSHPPPPRADASQLPVKLAWPPWIGDPDA